jgi:archaellum biogenesis protein FlaJ (TadC family)
MRSVAHLVQRLAGAYFRPKEDATIVFHPFGPFASGYRLSTEGQLTHARSWVERYIALGLYLLLLTGIGICVLLFLGTNAQRAPISRVVLFAVVMVWALYPLGWVAGAHRLSRKLRLEPARPSLREAAAQARADLSGSRLVVLIVAGLFFAVVGPLRLAYIPGATRSVADIVFWGGAAFLGLTCCLWFVYVLTKGRRP